MREWMFFCFFFLFFSEAGIEGFTNEEERRKGYRGVASKWGNTEDGQKERKIEKKFMKDWNNRANEREGIDIVYVKEEREVIFENKEIEKSEENVRQEDNKKNKRRME